MSSIIIPQVYTITDGQEHISDLESALFVRDRTIWLNQEIDSQTARLIVGQLAYLDGRGDEDITLRIDSPGGSVYDGLMIYDAIRYNTRCDVRTVATGIAASMGAFLLAAGTKGKRFATVNAMIMIHQPLGGVQGQVTDIARAADHIQRVRTRLVSILAEGCGKDPATLANDMERDFWMSSEEAMKYGIIDGIITKKEG